MGQNQHRQLARSIDRAARQLGHQVAPELGRRLRIETEQDRGIDLGL